MAIHSALLPTGKVLMVRLPEEPVGRHARRPWTPNTSVAYLWDPATGHTSAWTRRSTRPADGQPTANIWCSGLSFLPDGRLLVTAGTSPTTRRQVELPRPERSPLPVHGDLGRAALKMRALDAQGRRRALVPDADAAPGRRTLITRGYNEAGNTNKSIETFVAPPNLSGTVAELLGGPQGRRRLRPRRLLDPLKGLTRTSSWRPTAAWSSPAPT